MDPQQAIRLHLDYNALKQQMIEMNAQFAERLRRESEALHQAKTLAASTYDLIGRHSKTVVMLKQMYSVLTQTHARDSQQLLLHDSKSLGRLNTLAVCQSSLSPQYTYSVLGSSFCFPMGVFVRVNTRHFSWERIRKLICSNDSWQF